MFSYSQILLNRQTNKSFNNWHNPSLSWKAFNVKHLQEMPSFIYRSLTEMKKNNKVEEIWSLLNKNSIVVNLGLFFKIIIYLWKLTL